MAIMRELMMGGRKEFVLAMIDGTVSMIYGSHGFVWVYILVGLGWDTSPGKMHWFSKPGVALLLALIYSQF